MGFVRLPRSSLRRARAWVLRIRRCDGQLASGDKRHDVGVVSVGGINWHEARHAVDVAADAIIFTVIRKVLRVRVHLTAPLMQLLGFAKEHLPLTRRQHC